MKTCIVCKCKDQKATFHKVPSNKSKREMWLQRCNIKGTIPNYSYVCSSHFSKEDYCNLRLRADALPKHPGEQIEPCLSNSKPFTQEKPFSTLTLSKSTSPSTINRVQISPCTSTSHGDQKFKISKSISNTSHNIRINLSPCTPKSRASSQKEHKISKSSLPADFPVKKHCAKRLIWRPSDVGNITVDHFSTPRTAEINLNTIKKRIAEQSKMVKCLKQKNRRLLAKVTNLKQMVHILEAENMLSEQASQILKLCHSSVLGEILSKTKKGKFSPELRKFAVTLQFYSARAYEFVRKHFKNALPHPKSVSRWYK